MPLLVTDGATTLLFEELPPPPQPTRRRKVASVTIENLIWADLFILLAITSEVTTGNGTFALAMYLVMPKGKLNNKAHPRAVESCRRLAVTLRQMTVHELKLAQVERPAQARREPIIFVFSRLCRNGGNGMMR